MTSVVPEARQVNRPEARQANTSVTPRDAGVRWAKERGVTL
jgi:hypothetical protein